MAPRLIRAFTVFPKEMYRIHSGQQFRIRHHPTRPPPGTIYDLVTEDGLVKPKALNATTYEFPNGFSMRPNDIRQQQLVQRAKPTSFVYTITQGLT
ncbi:MAG: hypothetical protein Q9196_001206 [Gyalolechia fulgens]